MVDFFYRKKIRSDGSEDYDFFMDEDLFCTLLMLVLVTGGAAAGYYVGSLIPKPDVPFRPGEPRSW